MARPTTIVNSCVAAVAVLAGALLLTGCDTGDGKQLQPFDPADYPIQTVPSSIVDGTGALDLGSTAIDDGLGEQPQPPAFVTAAPGSADEAFSLSAPWSSGDDIDVRYSCDGENVAPALSWGAVPAGTVEIAITLVDESSVSNDQPFVHWVIGGLDPLEVALAEGDVPPGAVQALNFSGDVGYGGPCPPPGDDAHVYRLTAYALNKPLALADGERASKFLDTIATSAIGSIDLTGFFAR